MKKRRKQKREFFEEKQSLPQHCDFSRGKLDLDAEHAWKNFGGKTMDEAYALFCERPDIYQEDFMFMGTPAFIFYFPVIDRYIRSIEKTEEFADSQTSILGSAISLRLEFGENLKALHPTVLELCDYVCSNAFKLAYEKVHEVALREQYRKLQITVSELKK